MIYGALTPNLNADLTVLFSVSAEREGFEPPVPLGTAVFKTAVIDHSTISPSDLGGARTLDPMIKSHLLYQLSYQVILGMMLFFVTWEGLEPSTQ